MIHRWQHWLEQDTEGGVEYAKTKSNKKTGLELKQFGKEWGEKTVFIGQRWAEHVLQNQEAGGAWEIPLSGETKTEGDRSSNLSQTYKRGFYNHSFIIAF